MNESANAPIGRMLAAAREFVAAGICVIPIEPDGSKGPAKDPASGKAVAWKRYQERIPTDNELQNWFTGSGSNRGIAVVCGQVSGNLEILDFDIPGAYEEFENRCISQGLGQLLDRCPLIETPSGGRHVYYRCDEPVGPRQMLARDCHE